METLSKLFKRTSVGKIQEWWMEVEGDKYRTISGQQDGKKVTSAWTTAKGMNIGKSNETTPEEQALKAAKAKWVLKRDGGEYKEDISEIDNIVFKSPMLAEDYLVKKKGKPDRIVELTYPVYVQPKLDGMRCIVNAKGMWSRNGKPIVSSPHIREILQPVFDKYPDIELDGELYNHELKDNFDELISIIKQTKPGPEELAKSLLMTQFHVYDYRDENEVFSERTEKLWDIVSFVDSKSIVFVMTHFIPDKKQLDDCYDEFLEAGYEGQMIRTNTVYEFDRTMALLKRKEMITKEFKIVEVIEGKGNRAGMAGKVVVELDEPTTDGKTTCEAGIKGGVAFYTRLLQDKDLVIGEEGTIEFQNYTPKGSLRFPKLLAIRNYE